MGRPMLQLGSTGPAVLLLQKALNAGKSLLAKLAEDSAFGPKTRGRVCEFQRDNGLAADGIVGPLTHASLEDFYKLVEYLVGLAPPQNVADARVRIVAAAVHYYSTYGWAGGGDPPDTGPNGHRIAARWWYGDVVKDARNRKGRRRHGGETLATIFHTVGMNAASCPVLSEAAHAMYRRQFTAEERNNTDIASWCGMFALFVYKSAGLKTGAWQIGTSIGAVKHGGKPCFRSVPFEQTAEGDVGIIQPQANGRNHHVLITRRAGETIETVEGNANTKLYQTITEGAYTVSGKDQVIRATNGDTDALGRERAVFYTPNWEVVLTT